jgi:hypothetical protein
LTVARMSDSATLSRYREIRGNGKAAPHFAKAR